MPSARKRVNDSGRILGPLVRPIVERLHNGHAEHQERINRLAARGALLVAICR
jgi:hypothetical protein